MQRSSKSTGSLRRRRRRVAEHAERPHFVDVEGRHRRYRRRSRRDGLSGGDRDHTRARETPGHRCRADDHGLRAGYLGDVVEREMIAVLLRDEDNVGLGES